VVDDPNDEFASPTRYERVENLEGFSTQLSGSHSGDGPFSTRAWGYVNRQKEDRRRYDDESYDTISRNGTYSIRETALNSGGAVHSRYDLTRFGALRFAANGRYERFEAQGRRCQTGGGGGGGGSRCGTGGSQVPYTNVDSDADLGAFSLGAEYEVEPLAGLGLVLGYSHAFLEGDQGVDDDGSIFLAGITGSIPWEWETDLRASAAHKIRFPSVVQLYDPQDGNPGLDPERCWCFEAAVMQTLPFHSSVELVGFLQELDDFIERADRVSGQPQGAPRPFLNRQKLRIWGTELSLASRPIESVELRFSYAYLKTKDRSNDRNYPRLANRPEHTVDLDARYYHPWDGDLRVALRYLDGIEEDGDPPALKQLDDFTAVDLRIAQRFWNDRVEIYAGVDNVFDEEVEVNFGFPLAGRTFLGGGSIRF
jgi:hypothetical protein